LADSSSTFSPSVLLFEYSGGQTLPFAIMGCRVLRMLSQLHCDVVVLFVIWVACASLALLSAGSVVVVVSLAAAVADNV